MAPIRLDGRTGEGGGQLVRMAVALASLTSQPINITNIRGNRPSGGGLKNQHVNSIRFLAKATNADTTGVEVGSKQLTFIPRSSPTEFNRTKVKIASESGAASALLVLQAVLPFLLFASNEANKPIEVDLEGGTNVSFSLSYEYLDQVLLPTLEERFGIVVERTLRARSWSLGSLGRGLISLQIHPVQRGKGIVYLPAPTRAHSTSVALKQIDVTILTPAAYHQKVQRQLVEDLSILLPDVDVQFKTVDDSKHDARWYILLVAHSVDGVRWGRDSLSSLPKKSKTADLFISKISKAVSRTLFEEIERGGYADEFLQDQLVTFQALAEGISAFARGDCPSDVAVVEKATSSDGKISIEGVRKEKTVEPFGYGSLHAQTARWVVGELIPGAMFYNKGNIVQGAGFTLP